MSISVTPRLTRLHSKLGWVWITIFSGLGLLLEALHGFKVGFYLDVGNETRRLMWTLAHTHGTLLGLVHLAFAWTLTQVESSGTSLVLASRALTAAGVLLPTGFFLGGLLIHGGDPGIAVLSVPAGGILLFAGALLTARRLSRD